MSAREQREVLDSWKEISAYLGRDVRTCRRWETRLGLPVHRLDGSPKARVRAYKDEIDRWLEKTLHEGEPKPPLAPIAFLLRWPVVAVFVALLAVGVLGWRSLGNGHRPRYLPDGGRPALAVLPFVNGTGEVGLDYLRESLPDHVIRDLQRSAGHVQVFSLAAVAEAIRGLGLEPGAPLTPDDLAAVAARMGAGWLLVSYVSKAGPRLHVDYELRDAGSLGAPDGAPSAAALRTARVPGAESDMPTLTSRVAAGVRRAFGLPAVAKPAALLGCTLEATRFYETARAYERKHSLTAAPDDLAKMFLFMEKARDADPGCALAYLGLGDACQHRFVFEGLDAGVLRLMKENYLRAYGMAPERAETNIGAGWIRFIEGDNDGAFACFNKAVELDPLSLHVLIDTGAFLRSIGLLERAADRFTRAILAGGTTAEVYMLRGWSYEHSGFYESALADYDAMIELEPNDSRTRCLRARTLVLMRRYDAAAAELASAEAIEPGSLHAALVRGLLAAAKGRREEALAAIAPERIGAGPGRYSYFRSRIYAALGMNDEAVAAIEGGISKSFEEVYDYCFSFPFLNNTRDHFYDGLRGDPRFEEILRREERKYVAYLEKFAGL